MKVEKLTNKKPKWTLLFFSIPVFLFVTYVVGLRQGMW